MTAVIIGRFQVPKLHLGHIYLISTALQEYDQVVILLGESQSRDERNPYSLQERADMIKKVFTSHVLILQINDRPGEDHAWSDKVDTILDTFYNPVLLHSRDSFKDHYVGKYPLREIPELPGYSGTQLRKQLKMEKIPTAEEFIIAKFKHRMSEASFSSIHESYIEFAKLHVQAAIEAIAVKAKKTAVNLTPGKPNADWRLGYDLESILTAYPLENIK